MGESTAGPGESGHRIDRIVRLEPLPLEHLRAPELGAEDAGRLGGPRLGAVVDPGHLDAQALQVQGQLLGLRAAGV